MLIPSEKPGQLANRLAILSHFIAFSIEYNVPVLCHIFDEYCDFFEVPQKGLKIKGEKISHFMDSTKFKRRISMFLFTKISRFMRKSHLSDLPFAKNIYLKNDEERFLMNDPQNLALLTSKKTIYLS